jgi:hypothetical protein
MEVVLSVLLMLVQNVPSCLQSLTYERRVLQSGPDEIEQYVQHGANGPQGGQASCA